MFFPKLEHSRMDVSVGDVAIGGSTMYYKPLTTPAGANTKSAWTEIVAATAFDVAWLLLEWQVSANAFDYADIGIGPAGSEVVVVPNLLITRQFGGSANADITFPVPLSIPKGTRIAVRFQHHSGGSNLLRVKIHMFAAGFYGEQSPTRWQDWGTNTATTISATVTTGGVNTKGSYVQLIAATAFDTRWLILTQQCMESPRHFAWDLAVGGAGAEVVVLSDLNFTCEQNGEFFGPIPLVIPKGSRVSARAASSTATSSPRIGAYGGG